MEYAQKRSCLSAFIRQQLRDILGAEEHGEEHAEGQRAVYNEAEQHGARDIGACVFDFLGHLQLVSYARARVNSWERSGSIYMHHGISAYKGQRVTLESDEERQRLRAPAAFIVERAEDVAR